MKKCVIMIVEKEGDYSVTNSENKELKEKFWVIKQKVLVSEKNRLTGNREETDDSYSPNKIQFSENSSSTKSDKNPLDVL
jgi:hypothetical protein